MSKNNETLQEKPIPGFKGYTARSDGAIISYRKRNPRLLKKSPHESTYTVILRLDERGKTKNMTAATLLLEALVGPRPSRSHVAFHRDLNAANDSITNLMWLPRRDAQLARCLNTLRSQSAEQITQPILDIVRAIQADKKVEQIARELGTSVKIAKATKRLLYAIAASGRHASGAVEIAKSKKLQGGTVVPEADREGASISTT